MTGSVCLLSENVLDYPNGGGHMWVYLNWALGLRSLGIEVVWLVIPHNVTNVDEVCNKAETLKRRLSPYHFADSVAVCSESGESIVGVSDAFDPSRVRVLPQEEEIIGVRKLAKMAVVEVQLAVLRDRE